ncbi:hypothetical protein LPB140_01660 [Sphingorhabdus lutea]|uniref:DUF1491 family protein n=1 Tax=Sphingorhabdus lutea TaxID=1913578 RepID=A0A1L3J9F0_9SPHN|nr:DUF1491 family protein [Sphingorhabdus lutea]APG61748.1 hypothetical protein LPB140_01660 [Sphingorhabdus lutea]
MTARLLSKIKVQALVKLANAHGDHATVLKKGDESAGEIILITAKNGQNIGLYTYIMDVNGHHIWQEKFIQDIDKVNKIEDWVLKRKNIDPDIWVIELDIADDERLGVLLDSLS